MIKFTTIREYADTLMMLYQATGYIIHSVEDWTRFDGLNMRTVRVKRAS